ncbi:acylphosphatase [Candidatus Omnitrophota bacterium]
MNKVRAHVVISGLVQGVFFRSDTMEEATRLGLTGWVKNRWDGRVEAVFEGEKQDVDKMISWCYQGPPAARVDTVEIAWEDYTGKFDSFFVTY